MNDSVTHAHRVAFRAFGIPLAHVRTTAAVIKELDGIRWRLRGRCASDKSDAWFMDPRMPAARTARSVCASCPVRATGRHVGNLARPWAPTPRPTECPRPGPARS